MVYKILKKIFISNLGTFANQSLKIRGKLGSKFILALTIDLIKIWPNSLQNEVFFSKSDNERIINNEYVYYIPMSISNTCEKGYFFDNKM